MYIVPIIRYDALMKVIFVIAKSLADLSKVREVARRLPHNIETSLNFDRFLHMLRAGPGDRQFHLVIDYDLYADAGFLVLKEQIELAATKNGVDKVQYYSFAPQEQILELKKMYPDVSFIPRDEFFADLPKHLC